MPFVWTTADNNAAADYERCRVEPVAGSLGAEIHGIDVTRLDEQTIDELGRAMADHLVVFITDQSLAPADLAAFARRWGTIGDDPFVAPMPGDEPVVRVLKEADEKHGFVFGAAWHSDWSFQAEPPSYTMLYAVDVPEVGGDTLWCNMYLAHESISPGLRATLGGLRAEHSPRAAYGAAATHNELVEHMDIPYGEAAHVTHQHPVVRVHPVTGRPALYVNPGYTTHLVGWDPEESSALLGHLYDVATQPAACCRHRWRPGTLTIWDNRATMHLPISDYLGRRRELYRVTVRGEAPVAVTADEGEHV